jgi:hypothetical protein
MKSRLLLKEYEEKALRRFLLYRKKVLFAIRPSHKDTRPVFVQGCGRSGTTMLMNVFIRDDRIEALNENDRLIAKDFMLVRDNIAGVIKHSKAQVLAMKPILNSFEAADLLKHYPCARVIWMLRNYADMANSTIRKFGSIVPDYIKDLVIFHRGNNWLSMGMPAQTLTALSELSHRDFNDHDWAALVWWSVNRTVMLNRLYQNSRFLLLKYEDLVSDPDKWLARVYTHIGLPYKAETARYIHQTSLGKGAYIRFHPVVQQMCENLSSDLLRSVST